MTVDDILNEKLRLRDPGGFRDWRLWEYRSLNMHRGVLHWRPAQRGLSCADLACAVREHVKDGYQISWWRGFAFGALVEIPELPPDISQIESWIDTRQNSMGTWQWMVLACLRAKLAIGVHTWMEGWLAPTYEALLAHYEALDYSTGSFMKEPDRLMRFLTTVARMAHGGL